MQASIYSFFLSCITCPLIILAILAHESKPKAINKLNIPAVSYIYGIGGRDVTVKDISSVYSDLQEIVKTGEINNPYRYFGLKRGEK